MNKKTLKNMLWEFGTSIVLGVSYWFCRFGALDLHGMKQWQGASCQSRSYLKSPDEQSRLSLMEEYYVRTSTKLYNINHCCYFILGSCCLIDF